jgi:hypothetical protein
MADNIPTLDLGGYRRLRSLERQLALAPVPIVLSLAAWGGLLCMAVVGFGLFGALFDLLQFPVWDEGDLGVALAVVSIGTGGVVGLCFAYKWHCLSRLRCPHCGGPMTRHVADMDESDRCLWWALRGRVVNGRTYAAPFLGEGDRRPWVRVMKEVRACPLCLVYVDASYPHERTCSEEELARLQGGRA